MTPRGRLILYSCLWVVVIVGVAFGLWALESNIALGIVLLTTAVCVMLIPAAIMVYQWEVYLREQKELRQQLDGFHDAVEMLRQQLPEACAQSHCLAEVETAKASKGVMTIYGLSTIASIACCITSEVVHDRVLSGIFFVAFFLLLFFPIVLMLKDWEEALNSSHQTNGRLDAIREELQQIQRELSLLRGEKAENHPSVDSGKDA